MKHSEQLMLLIRTLEEFPLPSFLFENNDINSVIGVMMEMILINSIDGFNKKKVGEFNRFPDIDFLDIAQFEVKSLRDDYITKGKNKKANANFNEGDDSIGKKIAIRNEFPDVEFRLMVINWESQERGITSELKMSVIKINRIRTFNLENTLKVGWKKGDKYYTGVRKQINALIKDLKDDKIFDSKYYPQLGA